MSETVTLSLPLQIFSLQQVHWSIQYMKRKYVDRSISRVKSTIEWYIVRARPFMVQMLTQYITYFNVECNNGELP